MSQRSSCESIAIRVMRRFMCRARSFLISRIPHSISPAHIYSLFHTKLSVFFAPRACDGFSRAGRQTRRGVERCVPYINRRTRGAQHSHYAIMLWPHRAPLTHLCGGCVRSWLFIYICVLWWNFTYTLVLVYILYVSSSSWVARAIYAFAGLYTYRRDAQPKDKCRFTAWRTDEASENNFKSKTRATASKVPRARGFINAKTADDTTAYNTMRCVTVCVCVCGDELRK